jgi:uroporphyrinogen decarboxylase
MQDRMLFDPHIFSKLLAPVYEDIIESCRGELYIPFFFHSDGNIMSILPDLIEAGFNVVNPIQPESMDPAEVKQKFGDQLTVHGETFANLLKTGNLTKSAEGGRQEIGKTQFSHRISF